MSVLVCELRLRCCCSDQSQSLHDSHRLNVQVLHGHKLRKTKQGSTCLVVSLVTSMEEHSRGFALLDAAVFKLVLGSSQEHRTGSAHRSYQPVTLLGIHTTLFTQERLTRTSTSHTSKVQESIKAASTPPLAIQL